MLNGISRFIAIGLVAVLVLSIGLIGPQTASGFNVEVKVIIELIVAQVNFDLDPNKTDFYAIVRIDGTEFNNVDSDGQDICDGTNTCNPDIFVVGYSDWVFTKSVNIDKGSIPIVIKILDEDLNPDDIADIENGPGVNLDLTLDLATCNFSGELSGSCDTIITSMGDGDGDGNATIDFKIEITGFDEGPGLQIYCLHSPIWPQAGEDITITAVALSDTLGPKIVDKVEILITTDSNPASTVTDSYATTATVDPSETDFMYLCRVENDGTFKDTGWRELDVGTETGERAISILSTGTLSTSEDIVFIPDTDDYSSATDPNFLADVEKLIDMYYTGGLVFLEHQDKMNFWIAQDKGNAIGFVGGNCNRNLPNNWSTDYTFADAGAIIHRENLRDCATDGVFSAQTIDFFPNDNLRIPFVHESGHIPFGLADEYCNLRVNADPNGGCDGGYWQANDSAPNIFDNLTDCDTDPDRGVKECQAFVSQNTKTSGQTFYTYDPPTNDLMVDNNLPQFLDDRRINFIFNFCASGGC